MRPEERIDFSGIPTGTRVWISWIPIDHPIAASYTVLGEDACHYRLSCDVSGQEVRIPKNNVRTVK